MKSETQIINIDDPNVLKVIDNTYFSDGFPNENWLDLIPRSNYLSQIDSGIAGSARLLFIDGEEDSGKSTLVAQYVRKQNQLSLSVFFNPLNDLDYHIDYFCTNIVMQISHILKEFISEESQGLISSEQYRQSLYQLRKFLKKRNLTVNLVLDGLETKVKDDPDFLRELFLLVPFGEGMFKIIITGNKEDYLQIHPKLKREESNSFKLFGFSDSEALKYLQLDDTSSENIADLFKITKGYPGGLKTLKRIIQNEGYLLDQISKHTTYNTWLELDCDSVDLSVSEVNVLISLLSLSSHSYTVDELSKISSLPPEKIQTIIADIPIVNGNDRHINIVSSAHKKYFANILRGNRPKVDELLISFYAGNETLNSLVELPKLYSGKKEWPKVIELIDDQYLSKILDRTGSIQIVNDTLLLGLQAAEKSSRGSDILRYSIQGSIVNQLDNFLFWESEIEARIAIKDFHGAISLAESAVLLVDRLRLLALIARRQKELFDKVDDVLINLIQELYQLIDLASVGSKIYDIVTHLIYAIPNLAIEIIEKSSGKVSDKNINTWIMAKLSIAAIDSSDNSESAKSKKLEAIESLNPPAFKQISQAIKFLVGNYSAERVLSEVNKISDREEKLKLLRLWLNNNKSENDKMAVIINTAIDELVASTSETSITIEQLNELSNQLSYVKNTSELLKLFKRFKVIENDISDLGMVKDKFTYQLNMFQAEFRLFKETSIFSLDKILKEIEKVKDILVRLESFSEAFHVLTSFDEQQLKPKIGFIYSRIILLSEQLFSTTASQYKISEVFLRIISKNNPRLALLIISKINNLSYREKGRALALDSYLENDIFHISTDILLEFEKAFENKISKEEFYLDIIKRYSEADTLNFGIILKLMYYYEKIANLPNPKQKISGFTYFYKIVLKDNEFKKRKASKIEAQIYNNWKNLEADWEKIDEGFRLCYIIAKDNPQLAAKIFTESEKLKKESWLDSKLVAYTYLHSISLVIRAYSGLLVSATDTSDDMRIIQDLIARVPSEIETLRLWTEIGFIAYKAGRDDIFKKIVNDHVIIITHELINNNIDIKKSLNVITLIHISDPGLAQKYINKLDQQSTEDALENICFFYVTKRNPFDYYEANVHKYNSNFSDLSKAVEALTKIDTDNTIYFLLDHICKAIHTDRDLSKAQISTLINELQNIVGKKFPDQKNIKHEGYKIISEVKIAKLDKNQKSSGSWEEYLKRAKQISNLSDTIFIQSILLEELPFEKINNGFQEKRNLFDEICVTLKALPAHYEFVQRVTDISETMYHYDKTKWKKFVEEAYDLSNSLNDGADTYQSQKSIIDSMYRMDPAFAKQLIKRMDQDSQENKINNLLNRHYETLEVADKIKKSKSLLQKEKENADSIVSGIFLTLKALNSDKIVPKKVNDTLIHLNLGNKLSLFEVFPIYLYYMNNCAKTYRSITDNSLLSIHKDNFKESVNATSLIQILSQRKKVNDKAFRQFFINEEFTTNKPIKPKSREATFNFIKSWILDNADEFIIIADPFFEKEDLELLKVIKEIGSNVDVDILGSKDYFLEDVEAQYQDYWREISSEEPPFTNITFCRTQIHSDPPFHDRWIITKNSGLRIGTSVNSVGQRKDSEISVMKPNEALKIREDTLNEYITRRKKELNNERLYYKAFSL